MQKLVEGVNDLLSQYPDVAVQWHPTKNFSTPNKYAMKSNKKVWWIDEYGHEWEAAIHHRINGKSCPYCSNKKVLPGFNDLQTTHPELAQQWSKRNSFAPSSITAGSNKKVWWVDEYGHEWEINPASRTRPGRSTSGCPICSSRKILVGYNDLATANPTVAIEWHPKNILEPEQVSPFSNKPVWWMGVCGHEWEASPNSRMRAKSSNCPVCAGALVLKGFNDLFTTHPEIAAQWDITKNGSKLPDSVSKGSEYKASWKCDKGHEWEAVVYSRVAGNSCPHCSMVGVSKVENLLRETLKKEFSNINADHKVKTFLNGWNKPWVQLDITGVSDGRKFAVEYDGVIWHNSDVRFVYDKALTQQLLKEGYVVVRVRENGLNFLGIQNPNLLQINYKYSTRSTAMQELADKISAFIKSRTAV